MSNKFNLIFMQLNSKIRYTNRALINVGGHWRMLSTSYKTPISPEATFVKRHIGPSGKDMEQMVKICGYKNLDDLISHAMPDNIRLKNDLKLDEPLTESALLKRLEKMMNKNQIWRSYIGQGYYGTITPTPILRNVFENPGWYTSYTPYQPEISQGRLEALLNFQTAVSELTGLPLANASLLDEGTAAAEAMGLAVRKTRRKKFLVDTSCHPQTIAVVLSRAAALDVEVQLLDFKHVTELETQLNGKQYAGCLTQYPDTEGNVCAQKVLAASKCAHGNKTLSIVASDLLALTLIKSPWELGADIAVGSAQRFGVPLGFGGPHAGFFATHEDLARLLPGRVIGISKDSADQPALRMCLQVREQHIRRDKATSNICTAQALLANMASFYALYHGPVGLKEIATRVHHNTIYLATALEEKGYEIANDGAVFDTLRIKVGGEIQNIEKRAEEKQINLRYFGDESAIGISLDETVTAEDLEDLLHVFGASPPKSDVVRSELKLENSPLLRTDSYMSQPIFSAHQSETKLLRYMKRLENKDVSLAHSMIPLGSCTLKLNATSEIMPCSWPTVNNIHPFAPVEQTTGYGDLIRELEQDLCEITGYDNVCLAPNSGAQGEYAGLRAIAGYLASKGQSKRKVCLIPTSAHGTNPASAAMAGMTVQPVKNDKHGGIDMGHLKEQLSKFSETLGSIMLTYPSTFGVFDTEVPEICSMVHKAGGQVYLDGANLNAQVGLCRPGDYGSDVSHLNLHKTFSIPHGGGGPGVGPVCVKAHLAPFLPQHPFRETSFGISPSEMAGGYQTHTFCSAPFGSASIFPIPWAYIKLLGPKGVRRATEVAILNANYMKQRLKDYYPIKYTNQNGCCAHEFIIDCSSFEKYHITTLDVAKRLMDYGLHSPTMSWPVPSSLMIEPTESESREECDRMCDALISIRREINKIISGEWSMDCNPLKMSPHTMEDVTQTEWNRPYTRQEAVFPSPDQRAGRIPFSKLNKVWPTVGRLDDAYGDTHLSCQAPSGSE